MPRRVWLESGEAGPRRFRQVVVVSTHVDRGHTGSSLDANRLDETTHHLRRVTSTESGLRSVSADRE